MPRYAIARSVADAGENVVVSTAKTEAPDLPEVTAEQKAIEVADDFALPAGGPWVIDPVALTLTKANDAALDAAYTKPPPAALQALIDQWSVIEADLTVPASIRALAPLMKTRYTPRKRGLLPGG
jgi:NAD(P)-dependent dehydrogenase (short-subunit alcohol dehydrogenase family)